MQVSLDNKALAELKRNPKLFAGLSDIEGFVIEDNFSPEQLLELGRVINTVFAPLCVELINKPK